MNTKPTWYPGKAPYVYPTLTNAINWCREPRPTGAFFSPGTSLRYRDTATSRSRLTLSRELIAVISRYTVSHHGAILYGDITMVAVLG